MTSSQKYFFYCLNYNSAKLNIEHIPRKILWSGAGESRTLNCTVEDSEGPRFSFLVLHCHSLSTQQGIILFNLHSLSLDKCPTNTNSTSKAKSTWHEYSNIILQFCLKIPQIFRLLEILAWLSTQKSINKTDITVWYSVLLHIPLYVRSTQSF
jgi:hypothetical protein